jgi:hypothetical protein
MSSVEARNLDPHVLLIHYLEWMGKPEKFGEFIREAVLLDEGHTPEDHQRLEQFRQELVWLAEVYCLVARSLSALAYDASSGAVLIVMLEELRRLANRPMKTTGRWVTDARRLLKEHERLTDEREDRLAWMREVYGAKKGMSRSRK